MATGPLREGCIADEISIYVLWYLLLLLFVQQSRPHPIQRQVLRIVLLMGEDGGTIYYDYLPLERLVSGSEPW